MAISFVDALFAIRTMQNARLAVAIIILYDHLILFDQEVEHIWKGHWTFINILYLANRYYALAAGIMSIYVFFNANLTDAVSTLADSMAFHQWEGWTGLIFSVFGQVILQIRLYALYSLHKRRRAITIAMLTGFAICTSLCSWLLWKDILRAKEYAAPIPGGSFCILADLRSLKTMYAFWIPIIMYESALCIFALLPAIQAFLEGDVYFTSSGRLVRVLLRDSVIYFFVIVLSAAACLVGARAAQGIYLEAPAGFSTAMTATIGSRLVLNIRDARKSHRQHAVDPPPGLPLSQEIFIISK